MKKLRDFINEQYIDESLLGFVKKIKDKIFNRAKDSEIKVGNKVADMDKIVDNVNNKIEKNSHKNVDELLKDITEIVKKDMNSFNKIIPVLHKWVETHDQRHFYMFDTLIGDKNCHNYIINLCSILTNKYGWEDLEFETESGYDEDGRWEEGGELLYNTAYIAFMLSSISEEL